MEALVKIIEHNGHQAASAKDLHAFVSVDTRFDIWIKRMFEYGFVENADYQRLNRKVHTPTGGTRYVLDDYALTLDCAKEIAMIQKNEKGKEARQYFIEAEKRYMAEVRRQTAIPQSFAEALELAAAQQRQLELKEKEVLALRPKADFADRAIECAELTEISMACKVLGLPYGRNTFFKLLRKAGVFFKSRNEPLQDYVQKGYFRVKQKVITRKIRPNIVVNVPFFTEKGLIRMSAWLKERNFYDKHNVIKYLDTEVCR